MIVVVLLVIPPPKLWAFDRVTNVCTFFCRDMGIKRSRGDVSFFCFPFFPFCLPAFKNCFPPRAEPWSVIRYPETKFAFILLPYFQGIPSLSVYMDFATRLLDPWTHWPHIETHQQFEMAFDIYATTNSRGFENHRVGRVFSLGGGP